MLRQLFTLIAVLIRLVAFLAVMLGGPYLGGAFVGWSWNPGDWHWILRTCSVLSLCGSLYLIFTVLYGKQGRL